MTRSTAGCSGNPLSLVMVADAAIGALLAGALLSDDAPHNYPERNDRRHHNDEDYQPVPWRNSIYNEDNYDDDGNWTGCHGAGCYVDKPDQMAILLPGVQRPCRKTPRVPAAYASMATRILTAWWPRCWLAKSMLSFRMTMVRRWIITPRSTRGSCCTGRHCAAGRVDLCRFRFSGRMLIRA